MYEARVLELGRHYDLTTQSFTSVLKPKTNTFDLYLHQGSFLVNTLPARQPTDFLFDNKPKQSWFPLDEDFSAARGHHRCSSRQRSWQ